MQVIQKASESPYPKTSSAPHDRFEGVKPSLKGPGRGGTGPKSDLPSGLVGLFQKKKRRIPPSKHYHSAAGACSKPSLGRPKSWENAEELLEHLRQKNDSAPTSWYRPIVHPQSSMIVDVICQLEWLGVPSTCGCHRHPTHVPSTPGQARAGGWPGTGSPFPRHLPGTGIYIHPCSTTPMYVTLAVTSECMGNRFTLGILHHPSGDSGDLLRRSRLQLRIRAWTRMGPPSGRAWRSGAPQRGPLWAEKDITDIHLC